MPMLQNPFLLGKIYDSRSLDGPSGLDIWFCAFAVVLSDTVIDGFGVKHLDLKARERKSECIWEQVQPEY